MTPDTVLNQRYQVGELLGAGGMAVVYRARDLTLGRPVAIKVLRGALTTDQHFLQAFLQEARAIANLAHPNILTVHDFGFDQQRYYIVMEYVRGQDLKSLIKTGGALPVERALDLAVQMCAGVGYAHRAGLVQCDLKPQNMLVTPDGRLKVTDFGLARVLASIQSDQRDEVVWGTPQYFAPEQAAGEPPTPASDVYALGVVMFEMLSGRLPFLAESHRLLALSHLHEPPPDLASLRPEVPEPLAAIVRKVLSKEPSTRYRTADQLGRILLSYRNQAFRPGGEYPTGLTPAEASPGATPTVSPPATRRGDGRPGSRTTPPPAPERVEAGLDWPAVGLAFLAFVAVAGLVPLWIWVALVYGWM
ncbi:MAG: serine/threonine protein kinase [Chloroflexi bacterium]|nr:serine/threonine protein kinase [Chloroflexota bacterium]